MTALIDRPFLKMNGAGNEIVVLDLRDSPHVVSAAEARAIGARTDAHFDQLMVLHAPRSAGTDAFLRIYNIDGSLAGACGNGTRCVAWSLLKEGARQDLVLETSASLLPVHRDADTVFTVDMGVPRFAWNEIPLAEPFHDTRKIELQIGPIDAPVLHSPSAVNMGNPHAIFWVEDAAAIDLARIGPMLEHHPIFPERANISVAEMRGRDHMILRVWERGAGLTRACGSAACAAAVAAIRTGRADRSLRVSLPGGDLAITWREDGHVLMTGPVEFEHAGRLAAADFAERAA